MKNKYSYLTKNVFLFAISGFVPKLLSFFLVPLYTAYLTPAEYGVSDLINTTVLLLLPIFTLDIQDAVMRYALDKNYEQKDVFTIALRIIFTGTLLVSVGAFAVSFLDIPSLNKEYLIFFVLFFFVTSMQNVISLFCRGIDRVDVMVWNSIINSSVTILSNILFLVVFKWGLNGYLLANILGALCALLFAFFKAKLYKYVVFHVNPGVFKSMVTFSFPLIFSVIAWWINSASDRYILTWMAGVAVSGLFAVAYKIPTILSVFQNVFAQAWSISAIKEFDKDDTDGFIGNIYTMMNFAMSAVCSGLMIMSIPFAKILFSNEFFEAWHYVPPLLISVVFNAMALFIGSIFTAVKDTKTLSISTILGAVVNTVCNFIFIYFWDAYGAAIATICGYAVTLIIRHIILRKHIKMKVNKARDILVYIVLLVQMGIAEFGVKLIPLQIVALIVICLLYRKNLIQLIKAIPDFIKKFKKQ